MSTTLLGHPPWYVVRNAVDPHDRRGSLLWVCEPKGLNGRNVGLVVPTVLPWNTKMWGQKIVG